MVLPVSTAADPARDCSSFASLLGLAYEPEAATDGTNIVEDVWLTEEPTIECITVLVKALDRPASGEVPRTSLKKLKLNRKVSRKKLANDADTQDNVQDVGKTARGQRLKEKAMRQRTGSYAGEMSARSGGAGNTGSQQFDEATPRYPSCEPLSLDQAIEKVSSALTTVVDSLFEENSAPVPRTAGSLLAVAVQKLVESAFSGVLAHEAAAGVDPDGDGLDVSDIRIALNSRATIAASEFKAQHAVKIPFDKQCAFAWQCAGQVLLRLSIAAYNNPSARPASLDAMTFEEILSLLQLIVATMQPIVVGGQDFFRFAVKPHFSGTIASDVRRLEAALWEDEEENDVDEDGGLTSLRARAASLEKSGETPEFPGNKIAVPDNEKGSSEGPGKAPAPREALRRVGSNRADKKPPAEGIPQRPPRAGNARQGGRSGSQTLGASASMGMETSQTLRSGEASGVHGTASGATAVTRRTGSLPEADFISRRYLNSKQYSMQVKVHTAAPQNERAKQLATVAAGGIKSHQAAPAKIDRKDNKKRIPLAETSSFMSPSRNGKSRAHAVPDTPADEVPSPSKKAAVRGGAGGAKITAPRQLFSMANQVPPTPLDAIPNTTPPRNHRKADDCGISPSPVRQPQFGGQFAVGAIIPTSQEERNEGSQAGMPAPRAVQQSNWFTSAIVPRGGLPRGGVQQARAAMPMAAAPVVVAEEQEEAEMVAEDPAPMEEDPGETEDIDIMAKVDKEPEVTKVANGAKPSKPIEHTFAQRRISSRRSKGADVEQEETDIPSGPAAAEKKAKEDPKPIAERRHTRSIAPLEESPVEEVEPPAKKKLADSKASKAVVKAGDKKEQAPKVRKNTMILIIILTVTYTHIFIIYD